MTPGGRVIAAPLMREVSTGFSAPAARPTASATSCAEATTGGTKRTMTASIPGSASTRQHLLVRCLCRRAQRVHRFDTLASAGRTARNAASVSGESAGSSNPAASQAGAKDPETARIREDGDRPAPRKRLCREEGRGVDQLSSVRARITPACWKSAFTAARSLRGRPCASSLPALQSPSYRSSSPGSACFATRDPPEPARVSEGLEVEGDQARVRVVLPVLEQVVRRDVGLVPNGDEGREAKSSLTRFSSRASPERRSATKSRSTRRQRTRPECRVQARCGDRDSQTIGADEPSAVGSGRAPAGDPDAPSSSPTREAGGDHTDRLRSAVERLLDRGEHVSLREADDHQVRRFREHGAVSADLGDRFAPRFTG